MDTFLFAASACATVSAGFLITRTLASCLSLWPSKNTHNALIVQLLLACLLTAISGYRFHFGSSEMLTRVSYALEFGGFTSYCLTYAMLAVYWYKVATTSEPVRCGVALGAQAAITVTSVALSVAYAMTMSLEYSSTSGRYTSPTFDSGAAGVGSVVFRAILVLLNASQAVSICIFLRLMAHLVRVRLPEPEVSQRLQGVLRIAVDSQVARKLFMILCVHLPVSLLVTFPKTLQDFGARAAGIQVDPHALIYISTLICPVVILRNEKYTQTHKSKQSLLSILASVVRVPGIISEIMDFSISLLSFINNQHPSNQGATQDASQDPAEVAGQSSDV